jgi:hypothetical protein
MTFDGTNLLHQADAQGTLRGTQFYKTETAAFGLPSSMEIGVGYTARLDESNSLLVGGLFRNNNSQDDEYNVGAEYNFDNLFFVRGGYTMAPQAANDLTGTNSYAYDYSLGAGVHVNPGGMDLTFDYAYRHVRFFSGNNVVTLKFGF